GARGFFFIPATGWSRVPALDIDYYDQAKTGPQAQLTTSIRRPDFRASLISRAIRRPVDIPGSASSEYGLPPTNRFVPATMRVLISKTLNFRLSWTIVSRQNGPIIPPNRSRERSTTRSAISRAGGRRDSRRTT